MQNMVKLSIKTKVSQALGIYLFQVFPGVHLCQPRPALPSPAPSIPRLEVSFSLGLLATLPLGVTNSAHSNYCQQY